MTEKMLNWMNDQMMAWKRMEMKEMFYLNDEEEVNRT